MRIAIDAMGGDHGPGSIIDGALVAARHLQIGLLLVGARASWTRRAPPASRRGVARHRDRSTHRSGWRWREPAAAALRRKPRASIRVAADAVRDGRADALFSAGHTGASVMAAHAAFGRLPGVDRPALATIVPTRGRPAVLLDCGATVECRPQHLVQFALLGAAYARLALGCESPRVGLLSVGEEESKGNELTREAHRLLKAAPVRFVGNVEGRDVYAGGRRRDRLRRVHRQHHVEDQRRARRNGRALLHEELSSTFGTRVGYLLSRQAFRRFRRRVDYSEYGGAPLLGLNGLCIVGHGRSSSKAVRNAVPMAARFVERAAGRRSRARRWRAATVQGFTYHHDRIRVSRTGRAEGRHGPRARRSVRDLPRHVRRSRRGARASRSARSVSKGPPSGCSSRRTRSRRSWR